MKKPWSHPMWVRGLKLSNPVITTTRKKSHPMWVRGLKLVVRHAERHLSVAPYVGAWIETLAIPYNIKK